MLDSAGKLTPAEPRDLADAIAFACVLKAASVFIRPTKRAGFRRSQCELPHSLFFRTLLVLCWDGRLATAPSTVGGER
jgi:hypothetical protein